VFPTDVNEDSIDPESEEGQSTMYRVSKVMAHQATRDFLKREKPAYKLLTTHPVFVVGESKIQSSAKQVDAVNSMLWSSIQHGNPFASPVFVDVKDSAAAHVKAIDCSAPSGTEFNHCNSDPEFSWNEIAEFVKQEYPQLNSKLEPNWKGPFSGAEAANVGKYLGLQWRPWKQTLREMIDQQSSFQSQGSK
jgi:nucleoside-diphosphate-sugar epimerase